MQPKNEYPKYLFKKDGTAVLVQDAEEHKTVGEGLKESPVDWSEEEKKEDPEKEDPAKHEKTYREHMGEWESKNEKQEKNEASKNEESPAGEAEKSFDIAAMKADLIKAGFKESQLKKKSDEEIKEIHANLKG